MTTTHTPGIDLDRMAADAQMRLAAFINRTAAQQTRRMRESWGEVVGTAPEVGTNQHTSLPPITYRPPAAYKAGPYPWDDITAIDDEIENDLGTAALQLLVSYACIAVVSFALGLFVGQL